MMATAGLDTGYEGRLERPQGWQPLTTSRSPLAGSIVATPLLACCVSFHAASPVKV